MGLQEVLAFFLGRLRLEKLGAVGELFAVLLTIVFYLSPFLVIVGIAVFKRWALAKVGLGLLAILLVLGGVACIVDQGRGTGAAIAVLMGVALIVAGAAIGTFVLFRWSSLP